MKRLLDVVAVAVLTAIGLAALYLIGSLFFSLPEKVWISLGKTLLYFTGGVIGLWSFIRGSKVIDEWWKGRKRPEPETCTHSHGRTQPHNQFIE